MTSQRLSGCPVFRVTPILVPYSTAFTGMLYHHTPERSGNENYHVKRQTLKFKLRTNTEPHTLNFGPKYKIKSGVVVLLPTSKDNPEIFKIF